MSPALLELCQAAIAVRKQESAGITKKRKLLVQKTLSYEEKQEILKKEAGKYLENYLEKKGTSKTNLAGNDGKPEKTIHDGKHKCPCGQQVNTAKRGSHGEKNCPVFRDYNGYPEKFSWAMIIVHGVYDPIRKTYTHPIWGCLDFRNSDVAKTLYAAFKPE